MTPHAADCASRAMFVCDGRGIAVPWTPRTIPIDRSLAGRRAREALAQRGEALRASLTAMQRARRQRRRDEKRRAAA